jgi:tetratricopeptide (TPR) repeat protein
MRWGGFVLGVLVAAAGARGASAADPHAVAVLTKSLAVEESRSGDASPHLLPLLERLAGAQIDDGALAQATDSRRRALKIELRTYGGDSINAAQAMIALARVEVLRQNYAVAEPLLISAVPVLKMRFGEESPALIEPLAALARIALARGDTQAALSWARQAQAITARRSAATSPASTSTEPLRVLGAIDAAEQRFDDGEKVLRDAIARDRQYHGADSLEMARSLAQLANLLLRAQHFDKALPLIEQAIAIDQEKLGETHPLIADDYADLGLIYAGLGRDDAAGDALYFAIDLLERGSNEESSRLGYAELEIAPILRRLGQTEDADAAFKDAKHILDKAAEDERKRERQL